jgi:glycosyltransferase involved in cell wall biosynthesis
VIVESKGEMEREIDLNSIKTCFLSNYPPKECGIATFTKDLSQAMDKRFNPKLKSKVVALNAPEELYNYNRKVIMEIDKEDINHYIDIAKKINGRDDIKIVSIQHEFGIFGGDYGCYLVPFLEALEKPVVMTFHSVLPNPEEERKKLVQAIVERSSAIIVMAEVAVKILNEDYDIPKSKLFVVHHGIPSVNFKKPEAMKEKLNLQGKKVISTFGLLSRGKGIEHMIKAIPKVVEKHPDVVYLIMGETHPVVRNEEGESYRRELIALINKLGLKNNVKFYNKYLSLDEITNFLQASDIYVCTNLERNQITSGTLAYAMGAGKAVVSTPIIYAEEMLAAERGVLAKFKNPNSYADAINKILDDPDYKELLERNAYAFSRQMIWPNVALSYLKIFNKVVKLREELTEKFPKIKLNHLQNMTDNYGLIQFASHIDPEMKSGYTIDDNARALIFSLLHDNLSNKGIPSKLTRTYLNFIRKSQEADGNFKNNHKNEEEITNKYSDDSFGRTIWALGYTIYKMKDEKLKEKARQMFLKAFDRISSLETTRSMAFSLCGLAYYCKDNPNQEAMYLIKTLADRLVELYDEEAGEDWEWFESFLTYANAKLPESLFLAYDLIGDERYLEVGEATLKFLSDTVFIEDEIYPIGQNGWYNRNGKRALFDQQPLDVSYIIQAFLTAYETTEDSEYYDKAVKAFNWFLGKNHLNQMIYNENTGGCYDGLGRHSVNLNQGAESTVSYLMARIFLEEQKKKKRPSK